ncbi:MAG: hypothetical protein U0736_01455 [Gemmataceae bacterium]
MNVLAARHPGGDDTGEQLAGRANERLALPVLLCPGASPMKHSSASSGPTPNTVCVRVDASCGTAGAGGDLLPQCVEVCLPLRAVPGAGASAGAAVNSDVCTSGTTVGSGSGLAVRRPPLDAGLAQLVELAAAAWRATSSGVSGLSAMDGPAQVRRFLTSWYDGQPFVHNHGQPGSANHRASRVSGGG